MKKALKLIKIRHIYLLLHQHNDGNKDYVEDILNLKLPSYNHDRQ